MSNTITQRTLYGGGKDRKIVRLINIASDGSEETDTVIFSNAAFAANTAIGSFLEVEASGSSCQITLEWDQTTDSPICQFDPAYTQKLCFKDVGGIHNPNGSGATGDVVMTTANLDAGDVVTIKITIKQD